MKRILLAGALAMSAAMILPAYAQPTGTNPNAPPVNAPAAPGVAAGMPGTEPGGNAPGIPPERAGGEAPMHHEGGWAMHRDMWRHHEMMGWNPQQRCIDRLARRAAHRAYVETELNLTPEQRPLWDRLQNIAQGEQQRERQLCQQLRPDEELTVLDRMDRVQQFLTARLDALQAARPALQAFYQSLNPEQREVFDHPFRRD